MHKYFIFWILVASNMIYKPTEPGPSKEIQWGGGKGLFQRRSQEFGQKDQQIMYPRIAPVFVRPKKIVLIKSRGKSMKQKSLIMVQATVFFHTDEFIFVLSFTETGAKTAPRVPKLGYLDGWVPKLSSLVTLATSWAGVVCQYTIHKYVHM